jgi:RNA polymerase sigma-70 factor, ECF subfamily
VSASLPAEDELLRLVAQIQQGDAAAEERLVLAFSGRIRMMVRVRLRGRIEEPDVVQEVLMAAISALRRGQLREPEKLGPFIAGITRNILNNHLRGTAGRGLEQPLDDDAAVADLRQEMTRRERMLTVRRALGEIGEEDRRILSMTLIEGLKPGEIARRTGMTPDVVRARKSRALKKLTERLKGS